MRVAYWIVDQNHDGALNVADKRALQSMHIALRPHFVAMTGARAQLVVADDRAHRKSSGVLSEIPHL